jgi:DNA-directed RNA polymerase specialized sigma24 family protein
LSEYSISVPTDPSHQAARKAVRAAQASFERDADAVREARRKAFADAVAAGLSLREIAEETGLHHSTVAEIARSK